MGTPIIKDAENKVQETLGVGELIKKYIIDIDKTKRLLKEQKQMHKDAFEGDKEYHEEDMKIKDLTKKKNAIKNIILKTPPMEAVTAKVKELQAELSDMQDALSRYIQEHVRQTGQTMIEGNDGEMYEMVPVYKLRKKKHDGH